MLVGQKSTNTNTPWRQASAWSTARCSGANHMASIPSSYSDVVHVLLCLSSSAVKQRLIIITLISWGGCNVNELS